MFCPLAWLTKFSIVKQALNFASLFGRVSPRSNLHRIFGIARLRLVFMGGMLAYTGMLSKSSKLVI